MERIEKNQLHVKKRLLKKPQTNMAVLQISAFNLSKYIKIRISSEESKKPSKLNDN